MLTKIERMAAHFVARVFHQQGLAATDDTPALHTAVPCVGCGAPLWISTAPHDSPSLGPVVRVPPRQEAARHVLCGDCEQLQVRNPEIFEFIVRTASWRANRAEIERMLTEPAADGSPRLHPHCPRETD